jgi:hypothetical protein
MKQIKNKKGECLCYACWHKRERNPDSDMVCGYTIRDWASRVFLCEYSREEMQKEILALGYQHTISDDDWAYIQTLVGLYESSYTGEY